MEHEPFAVAESPKVQEMLQQLCRDRGLYRFRERGVTNVLRLLIERRGSPVEMSRLFSEYSGHTNEEDFPRFLYTLGSHILEDTRLWSIREYRTGGSVSLESRNGTFPSSLDELATACGEGDLSSRVKPSGIKILMLLLDEASKERQYMDWEELARIADLPLSQFKRRLEELRWFADHSGWHLEVPSGKKTARLASARELTDKRNEILEQIRRSSSDVRRQAEALLGSGHKEGYVGIPDANALLIKSLDAEERETLDAILVQAGKCHISSPVSERFIYSLAATIGTQDGVSLRELDEEQEKKDGKRHLETEYLVRSLVRDFFPSNQFNVEVRQDRSAVLRLNEPSNGTKWTPQKLQAAIDGKLREWPEQVIQANSVVGGAICCLIRQLHQNDSCMTRARLLALTNVHPSNGSDLKRNLLWFLGERGEWTVQSRADGFRLCPPEHWIQKHRVPAAPKETKESVRPERKPKEPPGIPGSGSPIDVPTAPKEKKDSMRREWRPRESPGIPGSGPPLDADGHRYFQNPLDQYNFQYGSDDTMTRARLLEEASSLYRRLKEEGQLGLVPTLRERNIGEVLASRDFPMLVRQWAQEAECDYFDEGHVPHLHDQYLYGVTLAATEAEASGRNPEIAVKDAMKHFLQLRKVQEGKKKAGHRRADLSAMRVSTPVSPYVVAVEQDADDAITRTGHHALMPVNDVPHTQPVDIFDTVSPYAFQIYYRKAVGQLIRNSEPEGMDYASFIRLLNNNTPDDEQDDE